MRFGTRPDEAAMKHETILTAEEEKHPLNADEETVLEKAEIEAEQRPTIQDFSDVKVLEKHIARDEKWLAKQQNRETEQLLTQRAKILEYVIQELGYSAEWFGQNCEIVQTTEYDDRAGHIDFVVEWENEDGKVIRLAVDVTTADNPEVLTKKDSMIRDEIRKGTLATVKYFKSEIADKKSPLENTPRIILAVSKDGIQKLCGDVVKKKPIELANSPEQLLLLEQIRTQMTDQIEYALKLLFETFEERFSALNPEEKESLKQLVESAKKLEADPNSLTEVLEIMEEHKNVLLQIRGIPTVKKYINAVSRQNEVLNIANQLIQEKSGSLNKLIVQQAAAQGKNKPVIRQAQSNVKKFRLPSRLEELALAA